MQCHTDESNGFFNCRSSFIPVCTLDDAVPESVKIEKKKNKGITYLPGEKLLIQLAKAKQVKKKPVQASHDLVNQVSASLNRVLAKF